MKVEPRATTQPIAYRAASAPAPSPRRCQTVPPAGRHSQNSSASSRLAHSTYVARSAGTGTSRVQRRLNHGRAITVCWTANSDSNSRSTATARGQGERGPWSMPLGTPAPAKKPMA